MKKRGRPKMSNQEIAKTGENWGDSVVLTIKCPPQILEALRSEADEELRTPEMQAVWVLREHYKDNGARISKRS